MVIDIWWVPLLDGRNSHLEGNGLRHGHILEAGMEDGAAHKLLLALASVALSLQVWVRAWMEVKGSL